MEKEGFIYIWYDRKRKMFYVGCHWGTENDGYICSSNRMRDAYRRRRHDFKRRIIQRNIEREELLNEEHRWLQLIKENELGKKYYNLRQHKWGHWSLNDDSLSIANTISNHQKEKYKNGTHQWSGENHPSRKMIKNGTHRWLKEEHKEETRRIQKERISTGVHPFTSDFIKKINQQRVENNTHNFQKGEHRKALDEKRSDTWEITFPNGEQRIVKNLKAFCLKHDLNQGAMNQVGLGRYKQHKGYGCKKLKKGDLVCKRSKNNDRTSRT